MHCLKVNYWRRIQCMLPPKTALVRKYARAIPALCKVHNTQQFDCAWLSSPTTPSLMAYTCMGTYSGVASYCHSIHTNAYGVHLHVYAGHML